MCVKTVRKAVEQSVNRGDELLAEMVINWHGLLCRDDFASIANQITVDLLCGSCDCGRCKACICLEHLPQCNCGLCSCGSVICNRVLEHHLPLPIPHAAALDVFVRQAVLGSIARKPQAGDLEKGMLYSILNRGFPFLERGRYVEFKHCGGCIPPRRFRGNTCGQCGLSEPNLVDSSRGVQKWLILPGHVPGWFHYVRRWGCGPPSNTGQWDLPEGKHVYPQNLCQEEKTGSLDRFGKPLFRVLDLGDNNHDTCPWEGCVNYRSQHRLKGTGVWTLDW